MDPEMLYLRMRADFHRGMMVRAACAQARAAHQAFVRAYSERIERLGLGRRRPSAPVYRQAVG